MQKKFFSENFPQKYSEKDTNKTKVSGFHFISRTKISIVVDE
jgi:hypothetical protein